MILWEIIKADKVIIHIRNLLINNLFIFDKNKSGKSKEREFGRDQKRSKMKDKRYMIC